MRKNRVRGAGILGLAAALLLAAGSFSPGIPADSGFGEEKFKVGDKAADFKTVDLDGKEVVLSSYQGKSVVLLNFWGLRCGACIEEIPHLNAINAKYKDKGLVVLGVDTDGVDADVMRETMAEVGLNPEYQVLLDMDFSITDTYTNFLVPLTLVIDRKGTVQYIHTGYESGLEKEYEEAVVAALGS